MSHIRRQSIISSGIVYFGFALGFLNTYFFTREGGFTPAQYGLISAFIAIANVMLSFAHLGMPSFIYKFYPYYQDHLPRSRNDMVAWALTVSSIGFLLVTVAGYFLRDLVVQKYVTNAPDIVRYYIYLFPFGFGLTLFTVLEAYAWQTRHSVLSNFLKEVLFRLFTTLLIVLFLEQIIPSFDKFVALYAFSYLVLAAVLAAYLMAVGNFPFHLRISRVTRRLRRQIFALCAFVWSGGLVFNISLVFDTLVIAAVLPNGLAYAGIYTLAQNIASLIQAPQRGIISAATGPLSRAWKDKDLDRIGQIYKRSSINQLLFSVAMFSLIYLNFTDGIHTFSLRDSFTAALPVFLLIGLMRILDMGTGVNTQILATSVYWRFDFFTGVILLSLALPMNYILTKSLGVIGPAISNLFAFTVYNAIRCIFLWKKVRLQPFTIQSLYTLILGAACCVVCYFLFRDEQGLLWICLRSAVFLVLFTAGALTLKLSPDFVPVLKAIGSRWKRFT